MLCWVLRWFGAGGGDDRQERRHGGYGLGGEHPVLGDSVKRGRIESGTRRPGLAAAAESCILPARIHVHHVLWLPHLRELTVAVQTEVEEHCGVVCLNWIAYSSWARCASAMPLQLNVLSISRWLPAGIVYSMCTINCRPTYEWLTVLRCSTRLDFCRRGLQLVPTVTIPVYSSQFCWRPFCLPTSFYPQFIYFTVSYNARAFVNSYAIFFETRVLGFHSTKQP